MRRPCLFAGLRVAPAISQPSACLSPRPPTRVCALTGPPLCLPASLQQGLRRAAGAGKAQLPARAVRRRRWQGLPGARAAGKQCRGEGTSHGAGGGDEPWGWGQGRAVGLGAGRAMGLGALTHGCLCMRRFPAGSSPGMPRAPDLAAGVPLQQGRGVGARPGQAPPAFLQQGGVLAPQLPCARCALTTACARSPSAPPAASQGSAAGDARQRADS